MWLSEPVADGETESVAVSVHVLVDNVCVAVAVTVLDNSTVDVAVNVGVGQKSLQPCFICAKEFPYSCGEYESPVP